jgi:N-acetylglucosaminyl-diphospho-decaprenol L-rhamnosyltransferase
MTCADANRRTPTVTIIIVNYNGGEHLARCLRSLAPAMAGLEWEAIVVDNASQDGSDQEALAHGPRVQLLPSKTNIGFGAAVNRAAAASAPATTPTAVPDMPAAPAMLAVPAATMSATAATAGAEATSASAHATENLLLLVNPDSELAPGVMPSLIDELDRYPDCAIIGPAILNEDGSLQGSARGDPSVLTGLFGRASRLTRWFPNSTLARRNVLAAELPSDAHSREVDWVSGACMLIRRDAFARCGGFDAEFFLYWEDADLCRRLRAMGYTIRYAPDLRVRHAVGQSSRTARPLAIRAFHASALRYYRKHLARGPVDTALARAILAVRREWKLWRA